MKRRIEAICPFCGIDSATEQDYPFGIIKLHLVAAYQILCENCGARGPMENTIDSALREFQKPINER